MTDIDGMMTRVLNYGVLGAVTVLRDGEPVELRLSAMRLLAALLCQPGRSVSVPTLFEELWEVEAPPTARKTVQVYIHRLRRVLGKDRLEYGPSGYRLITEPEEVDALRFAGLVHRARADRARGYVEKARSLLRQGLALWRGDPFANFSAGRGLIAGTAHRLAEQRLLAQEEYFGIEVEVGRHAEVITELDLLSDAQPFREPLRELQMVALCRAGRRAEALEVFRRTRALFVEELGIEPGATLQRLHEAILRDEKELSRVLPDRIKLIGRCDSATALARTGEAAQQVSALRQLPADVPGFSGREAEQAELDALLADGAKESTSATPIAMLVGMAGIGKTALAVHWAHQVTERFPDGQLYIDLCGYASGPAYRPVDAIAQFLGALGVPTALIPADAAVAAGMYRSLLADKRVLVLLDNAMSVEQVRPLLPAGPRCLVLITSRNRLDGLVALQGARRMALDVLDPAEARALIADVVGDARAEAEPGATAEIAQLCAYLPLALRIAAVDLASYSQQTIAAYVVHLRQGDPMTTLRIEDDDHAALRVAFDLSYQALPPDARRLFRLIGLIPRAEFTEEDAAILAEVSLAEAARLIRQLAAAHMVQQKTPGRYGCHDLLRVYATALSEEEDRAFASGADRSGSGWRRTASLATAACRLRGSVVRLDAAGVRADQHGQRSSTRPSTGRGRRNDGQAETALPVPATS